MSKEKVCIVGLGYIGLPTAAMFASNGHKVVGVDINVDVVEALNQGKVIIEEPYLGDLVTQAVASKNLKAVTIPEEADVFIIAVPTPITEDKKADMTYVVNATNSILPYLKQGNIVILESTSPVGTVRDIIVPRLEKQGFQPGKDIFVGHSPERVLPGQILFELVKNNRIIGGINSVSAEKIRDVYMSFVKGEMFITDVTTAEMCKLMENTYRDVNIALANELAKICENAGINAWKVIELCNKHPRVNIHMPGPGVGGHCLAVDPWFIVEGDPETARIVRLARETNDGMPQYIYNKIKDILPGLETERKVTILGLTYKPNIDDTRESPIIELIKLLEKKGFKIAVVDPYVKFFKYKEESIIKACEGSNILVMGVNHRDFACLPFEEISKVMRDKILLDTRNFYSNNNDVKNLFDYHILGCSELRNI